MGLFTCDWLDRDPVGWLLATPPRMPEEPVRARDRGATPLLFVFDDPRAGRSANPLTPLPESHSGLALPREPVRIPDSAPPDACIDVRPLVVPIGGGRLEEEEEAAPPR